MQSALVLLSATFAAVASAYSYVTVTADGATYVETIVEASDLSTPAGAYITYKVITGTKGTNTYTKTIWSTVYTSSDAAETATSEEAETTSTTEAAASATSEATEAASTTSTETTAAEETSSAAETTSATSAAETSSEASVSTYSGAAVGRVQAAAGLVGAAGVAALLI